MAVRQQDDKLRKYVPLGRSYTIFPLSSLTLIETGELALILHGKMLYSVAIQPTFWARFPLARMRYLINNFESINTYYKVQIM